MRKSIITIIVGLVLIGTGPLGRMILLKTQESRIQHDIAAGGLLSEAIGDYTEISAYSYSAAYFVCLVGIIVLIVGIIMYRKGQRSQKPVNQSGASP